ncbi:chemotaxis protein CheB, partial [Enterococcus faecalis]|uniref:chemotaxis protein CheB n=1 Tax=Enterococcus faecalis TaxID=1351 RepID=UPI003D6A4B18
MTQKPEEPRFVVGLGASAGGLEALERYFDNSSTDSGGAYVVVMHLARDFKSVLDELLARHTTMLVRPIEEGA